MQGQSEGLILMLAANVQIAEKNLAQYRAANRAVLDGVKNKAFRLIRDEERKFEAKRARAEHALIMEARKDGSSTKT